MRIRERSSGGEETAVYHTFSEKTTSPSLPCSSVPWDESQVATTQLSPTVYEWIEDTVTPDYAKRIAAGEIITNPFKRIKRTTHHPQACYINKTNTAINTYGCEWGDKWLGNIVPFEQWGGAFRSHKPSLLTLDDLPSDFMDMRDAVKSIAVTSAHANVDESEMLAYATIAESGKTIDSMAAILGRVIRIAKNLRKLRFKEIAGELKPKEVADRYMEARYALRPLMYDVRNLSAALNKQRSTVRRTYRGKHSDTYSYEDSVSDVQCAFQTYSSVNRSITYEVSAYAGVLCDVNIDSLTIFGVDKLPEAVLELIPLSFIVGWFANVGDTLAALTPNAGVTQRASWVTTKETFTSTNSSTGDFRTTAQWGTPTISMGHYTWRQEEQVLTREINPPLSVWPQSKLRLDGFKLLDLGIIARNLMR